MGNADNDRRLRAQYPNAIYHMMSRGVQRSGIFLDEDDRLAFFDRCALTVAKFGWRVYSVVQMTNHFHLLFRTPSPNLCRGAQYLLGPYAQGFNRRHGRSGHVFESRYRCRIIENEDYLWTVSRYDHLNPVPALVKHPASWKWSSYPGYHDESLRIPWVCYDEMLTSWRAGFGADSYCEYVEKGLTTTPQLPKLIDGWIMGSESFAQRIRQLVSPDSHEPNVIRTRAQPPLVLDEIVAAVTAEFDLTTDELSRKSSRHPARQLVALLASQRSTALLRDIAKTLGLANRDSVHKKIRSALRDDSTEFRNRLAAIETRLERHFTDDD